MAENLRIQNAQVKRRNPWGVVALAFVTLGIYPLYWYYAINREMRDLGEDVSPGVALLAITLGAFLLVPPFVSIYNTGERIKRLERRAGVNNPTSGAFAIVMILLSWLLIPVIAYYYTLQSHLNRAYESLRGGTAVPTGGTTGELSAPATSAQERPGQDEPGTAAEPMSAPEATSEETAASPTAGSDEPKDA